jgi:N-acetylneuraminic acid mutarotase
MSSSVKIATLVLFFGIAAACSDASKSGDSPTPAGSPPDAGDATADPAAPDPVAWRTTGALRHARLAHTATRLTDGSVLVVGGELIDRTMLDTTELLDPTAATWRDGAKLDAPRSNHVAVVLADGRVLVAGGGRSAPIGQPSSREVLGTALLYDPVAGRFVPTGSLLSPRSHFQAVRLPSGEVLAAGGGGTTTHENCTGVPNCGPLADPLASVERFDPGTGTWRTAASMNHARYSFSLSLLSDGRVLAVGGVTADTPSHTSTRSAEIYDPNTDRWTDTADMPAPDREHHSAILLDSGRVMVAGGKQANIGMIDRVDLFSPLDGSWQAAHRFATVRTLPNLVRLSSGRILAVGGFDQPTGACIAESLIFDEATGAWTKIADLAEGRVSHTATLLTNGTVLVAGGIAQSTGAETDVCEITTATR